VISDQISRGVTLGSNRHAWRTIELRRVRAKVPEAAMKRNRVVWSSSAEPVAYVLVPRRPGRFRRALRTGFLLFLIGLVRAARSPRWRCALLGAALTVPGLLMRDLAGNIILLPGLLILFFAPFLPGQALDGRQDHARLRRELAAYSTPAERRDLEALLTQYSDTEAGELRAILASQDAFGTEFRFPGLGHR
jgi:hypothetical protein